MEKFVKMSFEGQNLLKMRKWTEHFDNLGKKKEKIPGVRLPSPKCSIQKPLCQSKSNFVYLRSQVNVYIGPLVYYSSSILLCMYSGLHLMVVVLRCCLLFMFVNLAVITFLSKHILVFIYQNYVLSMPLLNRHC